MSTDFDQVAHPRGDAGRFTEKAASEPGSLIIGYNVPALTLPDVAWDHVDQRGDEPITADDIISGYNDHPSTALRDAVAHTFPNLDAGEREELARKVAHATLVATAMEQGGADFAYEADARDPKLIGVELGEFREDDGYDFDRIATASAEYWKSEADMLWSVAGHRDTQAQATTATSGSVDLRDAS